MTTLNANSRLFIDVDQLGDEPADSYHGKKGKYLSSHQLMDFRKCPLLYHQKLTACADEETPALLVGRAAHVRILEGRAKFEEQFAVGGPINPKTGRPFGSDTQAYRAWASEMGKPAIAQEQLDLIEQMASGVSRTSAAVDLLLDGKAEGVVRADYCGTPCQARFDWVHPFRGIVDLKTCDDLTWFEADARRFGYVHQLAFYRSMLAVALGLDALHIPVHLVAVEKREPFRCGVWKLGEEVLGIAQKENEDAIARLLACRQKDRWPTGYEEVRTFDWV